MCEGPGLKESSLRVDGRDQENLDLGQSGKRGGEMVNRKPSLRVGCSGVGVCHHGDTGTGV
jgi:hypothetical protein